MAPVRAVMDTPCAAPSGVEGLTVRTVPGDHVMFSTEYSDRSNENIATRHYTEGFGSGAAGSDGVFRASWHVPPNAPTGEATLHYAAQQNIYEVRFTVTLFPNDC